MRHEAEMRRILARRRTGRRTLTVFTVTALAMTPGMPATAVSGAALSDTAVSGAALSDTAVSGAALSDTAVLSRSVGVAGQPGLSPEDVVTPPPLPPNTPDPVDTRRPDLPYVQKLGCVSSLNENTQLANKPWGQDQLQFDELHRFSTGKGQSVAVIDTGVNPHEYLAGRLVGGGDYVKAEDDGLKDCDGHGTEVAGIIAANPPRKEIGFVGIAPEATIVSIRQSSANYSAKDPKDPNQRERNAGNLDTLAQAIVNAANRVPGGVMNMSVDNCRPLDPKTPITAPEQRVQAALRYAVDKKDVVVVASAGNVGASEECKRQNSGPDPDVPLFIVSPPWFTEYVISVAAMTQQGTAADFSLQGPWVSVAAPGTDIISLDPGQPRGLANRTMGKDRKLSSINGTSFAAPYVAGLAALVRDRFKHLDARQVMKRIKVTASHPAAAGGRDNLVGYGMINPISALTSMVPSEHAIPTATAQDIEFDMPPPYERNWVPVQVALVGAGGGLGLLLLTLFILHTIRRNRRDPDSPPVRGSA